MPLQELAALFAIPDVRFFSFQGEPERSRSAPWREVVDAYDGSGCLLVTAKRLQTMDLIITVDTMIAHLAGAMGRPVWTLLPFACDWRWMLGRADSPWYATMRLFRQPRTGDWTSVIESVGHELRTVLRAYPVPALSSARVGDCVGPGKVK
jgi:ADP-heptose:LPS heptosyltransferase